MSREPTDTSDLTCPDCGSDDIVPAWESVVLYEAGMPPKFVGCLDCNEMSLY